MATTLVATISTGITASTAQTQRIQGGDARATTSLARDNEPIRETAGGLTASRYRGHTAEEWAGKFRYRTRQLLQVKAKIHRRWQPTVDYALRLASAVTGVSYWQLRSVSYCESHHYVFARNGIYRGIFQMHWQPFGFSPYDPVASALSAAMTVRHDGGWGQWSCKP